MTKKRVILESLLNAIDLTFDFFIFLYFL